MSISYPAGSLQSQPFADTADMPRPGKPGHPAAMTRAPLLADPSIRTGLAQQPGSGAVTVTCHVADVVSAFNQPARSPTSHPSKWCCRTCSATFDLFHSSARVDHALPSGEPSTLYWYAAPSFSQVIGPPSHVLAAARVHLPPLAARRFGPFRAPARVRHRRRARPSGRVLPAGDEIAGGFAAARSIGLDGSGRPRSASALAFLRLLGSAPSTADLLGQLEVCSAELADRRRSARGRAVEVLLRSARSVVVPRVGRRPSSYCCSVGPDHENSSFPLLDSGQLDGRGRAGRRGSCVRAPPWIVVQFSMPLVIGFRCTSSTRWLLRSHARVLGSR